MNSKVMDYSPTFIRPSPAGASKEAGAITPTLDETGAKIHLVTLPRGSVVVISCQLMTVNPQAHMCVHVTIDSFHAWALLSTRALSLTAVTDRLISRGWC